MKTSDALEKVPEVDVRKTVAITLVKGITVDPVSGELKPFEDAIFRPVKSLDTTNRILRRRYNDSTVTVTNMSYNKTTYALPLSTFLQYATIYDVKEETL